MNSDHSVIPDKVTGWQQRQLIAKLRQFPLIFMNPVVDIVSKTLTSFGSSQVYRVVYMGPRHNSNMKAFKSYCFSQKHPKVAESAAYGLKQLSRFTFKHNHQSQKFFPIRVSQYRLFTGMNPTIRKDDLKFDSDFESGNLDLAIYVNPAEYDLVMRVDSNTKGHTAWFYFKVSNASANQKIRFNIINYSKKYLLYKDGMKPYVYKKSQSQWTQSCTSITYHTRRFRYEGTQQCSYQCLSFYYEFKDNEEVYFAYCIPYTYSYLLHRLQQLRNKHPHLLKISYDFESTGGLPIPIATVTNPSSSQDKSHILCIARLHPGQTQGSWMIDGFLQQLLTPQGHYLRDKAIFKIIPMVNVDGVVLGNFRTGIMGRDLNRCFNLQQRYNQIDLIRKIAQQVNPLVFIDFHGHSSKKNVFIYGPDYRLEDKNYLISRAFPKLISKQTEIFRYYSCSFTISKSKLTTGRAIMLKQFKVQFSYTVQASAHAYGPMRNQNSFRSADYQLVGQKISNSLSEFIKILRILPKRQQIKAKKAQQQAKKQENNKKQQKSQQAEKEAKIQRVEGQKQRCKSSLLDIDSIQTLSILQKNLLRQILKDQQVFQEQQKMQAGSQDSDFQDQTNDYSNSDINKIMQAKFEPKTTKTGQKSKSKRLKKSIEKSSTIDKSSELTPKKKVIAKNKSFSIKTIDNQQMLLNASQTIDVINKKNLNHHLSFEQKASKMLESNPLFMNGIIKKKQKQKYRVISENKQLLSMSSLMKNRDNNVQYDWSGQIIKEQQSSKHFHFQIPEFVQPIVARKKQQPRLIQSQKKIEKKKNPILSIKKSILPTLGRSAEIVREGAERSMLSQILQQHQRKKKAQRNVKIMFL